MNVGEIENTSGDDSSEPPRSQIDVDERTKTDHESQDDDSSFNFGHFDDYSPSSWPASAHNAAKNVYEELAEKEEALLLAAQFGKSLIDEKEELERLLESLKKEHQSQIEVNFSPKFFFVYFLSLFVV